MKLWISSDYTTGTYCDVTEVSPMSHGRAESGEILNYYEDDETTLVAAYYWDNRRCEYRRYTPY